MVYTDPEGIALTPASPVNAPADFDFDAFLATVYESWLDCPDEQEAIAIGAVAQVGFGVRVAQLTTALFPTAAQVVLRYDIWPTVAGHSLGTVLDADGRPVARWVAGGVVPDEPDDLLYRFEELCFWAGMLAELVLGWGDEAAAVTLDLDALAPDITVETVELALGLDASSTDPAVEAVR